jgi:RHS repeat-associated protein
VGETRIATKRRMAGNENYAAEESNMYFYHGDHLAVVTDYKGDVYEHMEYTPYGELWVEQAQASYKTPYRFTGKELDAETGLYYYGARYLDPRTSRWLSTDPAMGEYVPGAPVNDEVRERNENLPGMGGVFNLVNLHTYHYAGNNPVVLTDPDGNTSVNNRTQDYIFVRGGDGKYYAVAPGEAFLMIGSIDGILMYNGTAFKTHDGNNLDLIIVVDSKTGPVATRAPAADVRDKTLEFFDSIIKFFKSDKGQSDRFGHLSRGDGSKAGNTWFNTANNIYAQSNREHGKTSPKNLNEMSRDEWNDALKEFARDNPHGRE